jgi:hypothetical protein
MRIFFLTLLVLATSTRTISAQLPFTKVATSFPGLGYSYAVWGDYDRDGDLDVLVSGSLSNDTLLTRIYRNDGGTFTDIHAGISGFRSGSAEWGDYDNDGDLDILITGDDKYMDAHTSIYRNNNGIFSLSGISLPGIDDGQAVWGDYDNDGDLDILMAGRFLAKIFRNDGNSVFMDANVSLPAVQTATVAWGDYNNDGWLDALVSGDTGGGMITLLFKNTGGSLKADTITLPGLSSGMARWGDLDNDGDLDLVLDGMDDNTTGALLLFKNEGDGHFTSIDSYSFAHAYSSLDLGDYDNDGLLDIILNGQIQGCGGAAVTVLYHNEGNLIFTDVETYIDGFKFGSSGWGDYNNDGAADLLFTGLNQFGNPSTEIYRNNAGDSLFMTNTPPSAPDSLQSRITGTDITFSWNKATDGQTSRDGLSYNLFIGTSPSTADILSPGVEITSGFLLKPCTGNMGPDTSWTVHNLANGTYYWSVQSVDNGFLGSFFAPVRSFTITTSGIRQNSSDRIEVYPNPAKESLVISGISCRNAGFRIINSAGERIRTGFVSSGNLSVSGLNPGLYFLRVECQGKEYQAKFIKE